MRGDQNTLKNHANKKESANASVKLNIEYTYFENNIFNIKYTIIQ